MRLSSIPVLTLSILAVSSLTAMGPLLAKRVVLTYSDFGCERLGGKIVGHKDILIEDEEGSGKYQTQTFTKCEVEVKPKGAGSSATTTLGTLNELPQVTTFSKIVETSGLASSLDGQESVTILAVSDSAFAKMPTRMVEQLKSNAEAAREFVLRHTVPGKRLGLSFTPKRGAIASSRPLTGGDKVSRRLQIQSKRLTIGGAVVEIADVETDNGVIHVLDAAIATK